MHDKNNVEAFEITEYQTAPTGCSQTKTSTILLVTILGAVALGLGMFMGIYFGNLIQAKPIESKTTIMFFIYFTLNGISVVSRSLRKSIWTRAILSLSMVSSLTRVGTEDCPHRHTCTVSLLRGQC